MCNLPRRFHSLIILSNPQLPPAAPSKTNSLRVPSLCTGYRFPVSLLRGDRTLIKIVNEDLIFHFKRAIELRRDRLQAGVREK